MRMTLSERRARLLDAALSVIAEQGLAAATTRAIAKEAEMPLASFHYVFESHQALLAELVTKLADEELARAEAFMLTGETEAEALERSLKSSIDTMVARPQAFRALTELLQFATRTDGLRDLPRDFMDRWQNTFERRLVLWSQRSGVQLSAPASELAEAWQIAVMGLAASLLLTGDPDAAVRLVPLVRPVPQAA